MADEKSVKGKEDPYLPDSQKKDKPSGNPPVKVLRMGAVKCNIWKQERETKDTKEKFNVYSADVARTYRDNEDNPKDTNSLRSGDLLVASLLLQRATIWISKAQAKDRAEKNDDSDF